MIRKVLSGGCLRAITSHFVRHDSLKGVSGAPIDIILDVNFYEADYGLPAHVWKISELVLVLR